MTKLVLKNLDEVVLSLEEKGADLSFLNRKRTSSSEISNFLLKHSDKIKSHGEAISGLVKRGKFFIIAGGSKSGKSLFVARLLKCFAKGGKIWEHEVRKLPTLLFDTELSPDDFKQRGLSTLHDEVDDIKIICGKNWAPTAADDETLLSSKLKYIKEFALNQGVKVVIIDCIYKLLNENNRNEMAILVESVKELTAASILVIVVHHTRRDASSSEPLANLSGHSLLGRAIDGGMVFNRTGEDSYDPDGKRYNQIRVQYEVRSMKCPDDKLVYINDEPEHVLDIKAMEEAGLLEDKSVEKPLSNDQKLHLFIQENIPKNEADAVSTQELLKLMLDSNLIEWSDSYARKLLPRLVKKGYLSGTQAGSKKLYYQGSKIRT